MICSWVYLDLYTIGIPLASVLVDPGCTRSWRPGTSVDLIILRTLRLHSAIRTEFNPTAWTQPLDLAVRATGGMMRLPLRCTRRGSDWPISRGRWSGG